MRYISTRGQAPALNFEEVVLTGLATDGGLYVPEQFPQMSKDDIAALAGLPYAEAAFRIMKPFVGDCIPEATFKKILQETYASFKHDAVAPLKQLDSNHFLLELFHGPTLAFKDVALQLLGRLLDHFLAKRGERGVIMGATSGDTGSAAIEGCKPCTHVDIYILHPHNRVSEVQRRQMTTVLAPNVHNIAVEGDFDDCQAMVKASFADQSFLKGQRLIAVNSINWARIMAQVVYYFTSAVAVGAPHREVAFSVPSANFGDVFAGYVAYKMGLPIKQLIVATNANDILHRTLNDNDFSKKPLQPTLAPSMDIVVSSNFERLLFDLYNQDGQAIADLLQKFNQEPTQIDASAWSKARELFDSFSLDDAGILKVIKDAYEHTGELLDPHTATAYLASQQLAKDASTPIISLATAHPAKFEEAVIKAGFKQGAALPESMSDLLERKESYKVLPADLQAIQDEVARQQLASRG
ncbi:threonine synthase [Marinospirillum celere]|uniref:Threonine synthase n=1 Tax=Marinospirillum celere TaxID=1122252 RepID=A0A1I1HDP5_9GAMM|nr:threonine synthase [Marinospirillum celere]SFC21742.1 threonine synthase [Marinospirillum celere]